MLLRDSFKWQVYFFSVFFPSLLRAHRILLKKCICRQQRRGLSRRRLLSSAEFPPRDRSLDHHYHPWSPPVTRAFKETRTIHCTLYTDCWKAFVLYKYIVFKTLVLCFVRGFVETEGVTGVSTDHMWLRMCHSSVLCDRDDHWSVNDDHTMEKVNWERKPVQDFSYLCVSFLQWFRIEERDALICGSLANTLLLRSYCHILEVS